MRVVEMEERRLVDKRDHGERVVPEGWVIVNLGAVTDVQAGTGFPEALQGQTGGDYAFVKVSDISAAVQQANGSLTGAKNYLSSEEARTLGAKIFPVGTTLFAKIGEAIRLNRRVITKVEVLADNNVMGLSPKTEVILPQFVYSFMQTVDLYEYSQATTVPSVRKADIEQIQIPLPPINEQQRIVTEIETQFTRLDAGVAALKRTQAGLQRYKAAVLKAACMGKLVPQDPNDEPAGVLLQRILAERRAKWEVDLRARGKDPSKTKYEEPRAPETEGLPELPEGWCWATVDQLFSVAYGLSESLSKTEPDSNADVAVIRIPNVTGFGRLDLSELKYFPIEGHKMNSLLLHQGDVLFNWRNAPKWIGKSSVFDKEGEYVNASFLLRLRPSLAGYSHMVSMYLNFLRLNGYFLNIVNNAVNQANFNGSRTKTITVILPPLAEQKRIVAEVERRLSVVDELEVVVEANLRRAERLRQAILKRAFEGKLVPQDPSDEPASVLLERIREAREARKSKGSVQAALPLG